MKFFLFLVFLFPLVSGYKPIYKPETEKINNLKFSPEMKMEVGEELTYEVSYSFIKLGQLKIFVENKKIINGKIFYNTIAYIDSYSGLPFVSLHMIYQSIISQNFFPVFFKGIVKKDDYSTFTDYYFKYDSSLVRIKKGKTDPYELWTDSTEAMHKKYQDGLSILYYARSLSGTGKSVDVPCYVNEKKGITTLNTYKNVTGISIDAVKYDIACVREDGRMNFISIFGLTGNFEGWFSDDEASVPIVAKLKVIIGNVTVELKSWDKPGWTPPKFKKD